jgi:AcrR family transcriptional regulator
MAPICGRNSSESARRLRADARRNREHVLAAARDVFVEQGADAPLDEIARRAGVGIATLYRRFPDRAALIRAVVIDVLTAVGAEARRALSEEPDGFQALARYMHRALDARIAAVFPAVLGRIPFEDPEILAARTAATEPFERIVERARAEGSLRSDVAVGDIGLLLIRLSRPLPGPFSRELDRHLAHRHLDLVLAGLHAAAEPAPTPLGGPAMTLADLRDLAADDVDQPR